MLHAWGMTEMSPLGTVATPQAEAPGAEQGRALRAAEQAGPGDLRRRPRDGRRRRRRAAVGRRRRSATCMVRGPWVIQSYFKGEGGDPLRRTPGWFPTGDVVNIDPDGYIQITDRSKDVIKSGRRVDQLDRPREHRHRPSRDRRGRGDRREAPEVGRAADRGGGEEAGPGRHPRDELLKFYEGKIAKWWMPDDVVFVERAAAHRDRQALQAHAAPAAQGLPPRARLTCQR